MKLQHIAVELKDTKIHVVHCVFIVVGLVLAEMGLNKGIMKEYFHINVPFFWHPEKLKSTNCRLKKWPPSCSSPSIKRLEWCHCLWCYILIDMHLHLSANFSQGLSINIAVGHFQQTMRHLSLQCSRLVWLAPSCSLWRPVTSCLNVRIYSIQGDDRPQSKVLLLLKRQSSTWSPNPYYQ